MSGQATTRPLLRTSLLFVVLWVPGATLDVLSTEIARRQGNWLELNPSGFVPLSTAIAREAILTLAGTAAVLAGAWFRREALFAAADTSFVPFCEGLFQRRPWALGLIGIPLIVAIGRYGVVISNACYLTIGWSPIDAVVWLPLEALIGDEALAHFLAILICTCVLWYPMTALILRLLYRVNRGRRRPEIMTASDRN